MARPGWAGGEQGGLFWVGFGAMSDIRHSLLRRDALSAAKEVLYHLDIYFSSQLQNAPLPLVDKGPTELLEEFLFQVPKERGAPPKVSPEGRAVGGVRPAGALGGRKVPAGDGGGPGPGKAGQALEATSDQLCKALRGRA